MIMKTIKIFGWLEEGTDKLICSSNIYEDILPDIAITKKDSIFKDYYEVLLGIEIIESKFLLENTIITSQKLLEIFKNEED